MAESEPPTATGGYAESEPPTATGGAESEPPTAQGATTLFGALAAKCAPAGIRDEAGDLQDVDMAAFFEVALAYRAALSTLGAAVKLVLGDFDPNYNVARTFFDEKPTERATGRTFFEADLSNPDHKTGQGKACKLKDPSSSCKMQWLLRGLNFFGTYLKLMFEDDSSCAKNAYAATLAMYHGYFSAAGFKTCLLAMPGKDSVCKMEAICPELAADKEKLKEAILRDVPGAMAAMLPLVHRMIAIQQELGLWDEATV